MLLSRLLRGDVDADAMPSVLQQSSDVPDTDVGLGLGVVCRVGRLGRDLDAPAGRQRHRGFPDGPGPLAAVRLRLAGVQAGRVPRLAAVQSHVHALDAATSAAHGVTANRHIALGAVDRSTVQRAAYGRLHRELLDSQRLHAHSTL